VSTEPSGEPTPDDPAALPADPPGQDPPPGHVWQPGTDPFIAGPRGLVIDVPGSAAVRAYTVGPEEGYLRRGERFIIPPGTIVSAATRESLTLDEFLRDYLAKRFLSDAPLTRGAVLAEPPAADIVWRLPADISEADDAYQIELELPGISPDQIEIGLTNRLLIVRGEFKHSVSERSLISTRRRGPYEFRARFPEDVEPDRARARLAEGVLYITVPRSKAEKLQQVEVVVDTREQPNNPS
jgi:HSP20 family protein